MDVVEIEFKGHRYEVPEPRGEKALALHNTAMGAADKAQILRLFAGLEALERDEQMQVLGAAGVRLSTLSSGHQVAYATLAGARVDGRELDQAAYAELYARPGRYLEPHIVAVMVWVRLGFFAAGPTSRGAQSNESKAQHGDG